LQGIWIAAPCQPATALKKSLSQTPYPSVEYVDLLHDLAWSHRMHDFDSSVHYAQKASKLAKEINYLEGEAIGYEILGLLYENSELCNQALVSFAKAADYWKKKGDSIGLAGVYTNMGQAYECNNQNEQALSLYLRALRIREKTENPKDISSTLNNVGILYKKMGDFDKALTYLKKSISLSLQTFDTPIIYYGYNNLGNTFIELHQYDSALHYMYKCEAVAIEKNDSSVLSKVYNNMGLVLLYKNQAQQALPYLNKALSLRQHFSDNPLLTDIYTNLGRAHLSLKNYQEALNFLKRAQTDFPREHEYEAQKSLYLYLSKTYEALSQYDSALVYYKKYDNVKDSLFNINQRKITQELETQYQTEKKEKELLISREQNKRNVLWIGGISVISLMLIAALIASTMVYRRKQRDQQALLQQKEQILQQREAINRQIIIDLVKDQEIELKDALRVVEQKERKRIADELHEGVQNALAFIVISFDMMGKKVKDFLEDHHLWGDFTDTVTKIRETKEEIRLLSHNLRDEKQTSGGWIRVLENRCKVMNQTGNIRMSLDLQQANHLSLPIETENHLLRILQELLTNVLKHSQAKQVQMCIHYSETENQLLIDVEDDGVGFDPENVKNGIGLQNIQERMRYLKGLFELKSQPGEGTVIKISVPLSRIHSFI